MEGDSGLDVLSNDGILDIIPPSEYDPFEAKFCASLFWLVFHATEDGGLEDVPPVVSSPIQRRNKKSGFVVHPEIVEFLCKGEVYCIVCTRIFPGKVTLAGHWSVIQTLSRNGVYVVDSTDIAVTDASLEQTNPFNQGAHIALMDALMTAYSSQVVSIQSVVQAVRRFSTFSASRELPFDLEDALLLWVNKTNIAVNAKYSQPTRSSSEKLLRNREQVKKAGLRAEEVQAAVAFPVIDDLLKGLCNGRSLLGVLMFYEPNVVNVEDICCSSQLSTEDSVRNLDVFLGLCSQYFCTSVLALKVEDILYGSPSLKINIIALLAEMFSKCEGNVKEVKTGLEKPRSRTSCSENGDVRVNGYIHDNDDDDGRSHSAPVFRNKNNSEKTSIGNTTSDDKNIALKIQNYVENESVDIGKAPNETSQGMTSSKVTSSNVASSNVTSSNVTSSEDVETADDQDTVEVQGVVVKLRKKVPRSVEPGGGHEALLSRRMKKSLCGRSQEDISDTTSQTSEHEEQLAGKSDEMPSEAIPSSTFQRHEPAFVTPGHPDVSIPDEPQHNLNLDLHSFQDDDLPVDMLSPISETTEPGGSPGNSLNNSMSSTHDQQEFLNQGEKNPGEAMGFDLTPPKAQTPRKTNNQPRAKDNSIPRGSYILSDVTHTLESAFAAGIPIVDRESFKTRGSTSTSHSSEGVLLYRSSVSGGLTNGIHEQSNGASDSSNFKNQRYHSGDAPLELPSLADQRPHQPSGALEQSNYSEQRLKSGENEQSVNHWSGRRSDNRFLTFTKNKNRNGVDEDTAYSEQCAEIQKGSEFNSSATAQVCKKNEGSSITWLSQAENEERSGNRSDRSGQPLEPRVRKTNWGEVADEASEGLELVEKDFNDSPKADTVSRELNLLRLRLAEKQRDIEAQKQRTKEQQDEERKRLGQNVFWLAVGKGRERKEDRQTKWTEKDTQQSNYGRHVMTNQSGKPNPEPSNNNKFTTFTKRLSLEGDLPPSMGKLQDRTYNIKNNGLVHTTSIPEEKKEPASNQHQRLNQERKESPQVWNPPHKGCETSLEDRSSTGGVVRFRLSQQAPGIPEASGSGNNFPEISETSEKAKTPVLNYKSRINVPVTFQNKPDSEKCLGPGNFQNSENTTGVENRDFQELDLNSKNDSMPAMSPRRKVWDTETASNNELCIAVSESNYHIFDQNNGRAVEKSQIQGKTVGVNDEMNKNEQFVEIGSTNYRPSDSDSPSQGEDLETRGDKKSPNERGDDVNLLPVEEDPDTPKKGLALFIGEENTATNSDGLTPEQLRKREKFLRNRQQKIEEDKMKKEALLEKKRRKDEKMKEIQVRRELEEQGRQARLQEKREQAEHARQERQKYELKKKENFVRTNFGDATSGGNSGYARTPVNTHGIDMIHGGNVGYNKTLVGNQGVDGIAGGNGRYARSTVKTPVSGGNAFEGHGPAQSNTPSAFSGFTGVQSYVKPSGKTNRKLIINAVTHVCLPGVVNKETKEKCLQAMTESSAQHFLILFKEGLKFRALYSLDLENNQVLKVYGIGPRSVTEKMIEHLYKYNSGGKEFSNIPAKGFSLSVDGFTLQKSCWQSNKPSVPSKTASNFKNSRPTR